MLSAARRHDWTGSEQQAGSVPYFAAEGPVCGADAGAEDWCDQRLAQCLEHARSPGDHGPAASGLTWWWAVQVREHWAGGGPLASLSRSANLVSSD